MSERAQISPMSKWADEQMSATSAKSAKSAKSNAGQITALWPKKFESENILSELSQHTKSHPPSMPRSGLKVWLVAVVVVVGGGAGEDQV